MTLDVYNTHIELYPYVKDDYPVIEDMYTAEEKFTGEKHPCGYMIEDGKLFLPRGTSISKIESICKVKANIIEESDPVGKMGRNHSSLYDPRDEIQEESIKFLMGPEHQLGLNLLMGHGKAQPLSSKVMTVDGYKSMGDLKKYEYVIGSSGKPVTILELYPQGMKDIYEISLIDGRTVQCSLDHLWQISNTKNGMIEVISLGKLMRRHYREYAIPVGIPQIYIPIQSIRYSHEEEAQCILVDSPDHLYMTNNEIFTHNTYCVAYASSKLGIKTIVITPNEGIKQQWINTYRKMFEYRTKDIINIAGSQVIDAIMGDHVDPADVYLVNHATLRNYMMSTSGYSLHKFFKKIEVGIKVYDESHMEFGNILLMDFFSNTERTWYLTATFDRSDKDESKCFKRAFNSVISFGEVQSLEILVKHVIYHKVEINSMITPQNRANVMGGYQGFTSIKYGKYAFIDDPNQTAYNTILQILRLINHVDGKILIFVPLIEVVESVVTKLKTDVPEKSVAAYHSKISVDEKESALKKDIIVSTIKSCGTGRDIPGLRCVICCEPVASKVIAKQMFGRLRPYENNRDTYFFDIVDVCLAPCNWWFRARIKVIQSLAKKVIYLDTTK